MEYKDFDQQMCEQRVVLYDIQRLYNIGEWVRQLLERIVSTQTRHVLPFRIWQAIKHHGTAVPRVGVYCTNIPCLMQRVR